MKPRLTAIALLGLVAGIGVGIAFKTALAGVNEAANSSMKWENYSEPAKPRQIAAVDLGQSIDAFKRKLAESDRESATQVGSIEDLVVTNSLGDVFTGMTLSRVAGDGLLLNHPSGLVKAKWDQLPAWCRKKFGAQAIAAGQKELQQGTDTAKFLQRVEDAQREDADTKARVEQQWAAERRARARSATTGSQFMITGRVVQKTGNGLIVDSVGGHSGELREVSKSIVDPSAKESVRLGGFPIHKGYCLLVNHPEEDALVDGDSVSIQAADSGQFNYTTVLGASKTVRKFTAY